MTESFNIYQRINKVMQSVKYVKKDATVQGYRAVSHDQVVSIARQALVDSGIVIYPEQVGESQISAIFKPTGEATNIIRFAATYCIHFVNIDKPEDRITVALEAHANDNGDKAPGKAVTYATKMAILKVLCLETGENDESRTESDNIDEELELIANCGSLEELKIIFSRSFEKHRANTKLMAQLSKAKDDAKRKLSVG
jgi:ERF superfamily